MAKKKTKSQKLPAFGEDTGFSTGMKAACIKKADKNFLHEIALKHIFCDNPLPTAAEDACNELHSRVISLLLQNALNKREA